METTPICPQCHVQVRPTDYFCFNCGKNLHPVPPPTSGFRVALLCIGSVLLPPFGLFWGWPYLKGDGKSKTIGMLLIFLTVASFVITSKIAIDYVSHAAEEAQRQLNAIQGF